MSDIVNQAVPETEVSAKKERRRFSAKEKRAILDELDGCTKTGERGALLRRTGVYSSSVTAWRRARDRGELSGLSPKKRGPSPKHAGPAEKENIELKKNVGEVGSAFQAGGGHA